VGPPKTEFALPHLDAPGVEVWRDLDGTIAAIGFRETRQHCVHVPAIGTFRFALDGSDLHLSPRAGVSEASIEDAYCRIVLPLAFQLRDRQVIHASAVVIDGGVVALCGRSGAGKSTLSYALSRRGHEAWADDAVAFRSSSDGVAVDPLPFRLRLRPASAAWFDDVEHEKGSEFTVPWSLPARPLQFRALLVLERGSEDDRPPVVIERLPPADAFTAVLPHAYYLALSDRRLNRRLVASYLELADHLAVFRLRYTPRLPLVDEITARIEEAVAPL